MDARIPAQATQEVGLPFRRIKGSILQSKPIVKLSSYLLIPFGYFLSLPSFNKNIERLRSFE